MTRFDYRRIEHLMPSLHGYIEQHIPTGGFLEAVLSNNLKEACGRADDENLWLIPIICAWLYNQAPLNCWGSPERVQQWLSERDVCA